MKITIVGTGYVGLVTGTCLANSGNDVICLDVAADKIARLRQGQSPIYEPGLEELIQRNHKSGRLRFTTDKAEAYREATVIFICVGTPSDSHGYADLRYVLGAAVDVGQAIEAQPAREKEPPIVVVKSTVPVGTGAKVWAEIARHTAKPFRTASNPEFLKEGAAIADFTKPDRVVIGAQDEWTGNRLRELHEPFVRQGNPVYLMDIASAEMVKYSANAMLATKISFINEISRLCESFGADIDQVRRGMCADRRIGNQFLYPGLGYGGSCFPKDVLACVSMGKQSQTPTPLLAAVHEVNQNQREAFAAKILAHYQGKIRGCKLAVWGIAFKPGTDDVREAPSLSIMQRLLEAGAVIAAHDPVAHGTCRAVLGDKVSYHEDMYAPLAGAEGLIVCTDWDEFKHPDFPRMRGVMQQAVIFDGRNLYRPQAMEEYGFSYYSVGRKTVAV
ncbi:MAG: UDP-glucose/GDP-mannose dehydrogenase family protein [Phycisphaeraceae bacterium]|nr:UDP-glucose/GDP-mannose dehydrogenase family protein [Phycisphaeraceae bacterium]